MGRLGKKFCLILDIDKVLSAEEFLAVNDSAQSPKGDIAPPRASSKKRVAESGA
jgi:hypothetical protein